MKRSILLFLMVGLTGLLVVGETQALTKMPRDLNYMSFYLGSSSPYGKVGGIPGFGILSNGSSYKTDASNVWGKAIYGGFDYGTIYFDHWSVAIGFRFVKHDYKNPIEDPNVTFPFFNVEVKSRQYDVGCDVHYLFNNLKEEGWTPFVGVSLFSGFSTLSASGFESENRLNLTFGLDFGAEARLYRSKTGRNFVTLASVNTYNILATGDRPKYFQLGGALKYYFSN